MELLYFLPTAYFHGHYKKWSKQRGISYCSSPELRTALHVCKQSTFNALRCLPENLIRNQALISGPLSKINWHALCTLSHTIWSHGLFDFTWSTWYWKGDKKDWLSDPMFHLLAPFSGESCCLSSSIPFHPQPKWREEY
jgi:hypothetical protein